MANFRRRKPRTRTSPRGSTASWRARRGLKPVRIDYGDYWPDKLAEWKEAWPARFAMLGGNPAWWDRVFHNRPHRAKTKRLERKVLRDQIDPDDTVWPISRKPTQYYW